MVKELAKTFTRKGELNSNRSRMHITYTQLKASGTGVYIYSVDYDGAIHYTIFMCDYYEYDNDVFELWPDELACFNGKLVNTRDYFEAQDVYWELLKKQEELTGAL